MADPHHASDSYVRGSQEISEQETTFDAFMGLTKWGALAVACVLVFLTLWFHPGGTFVAGFIGAAVLAAVGFWALKPKGGAGH